MYREAHALIEDLDDPTIDGAQMELLTDLGAARSEVLQTRSGDVLPPLAGSKPRENLSDLLGISSQLQLSRLKERVESIQSTGQGRADLGKPHAPISEAPFHHGLSFDDDAAMVAGILRDLVEEGGYDRLLSFQHLQKGAAVVEEEPANSELLVICARLRQ